MPNNNLYLIDTNVLVLLIIGMTDPSLIERHKKSGFTAEDYYTLLDFLGTDPTFLLLPHVVAETSSLLGLIGDQYRKSILETFRHFIISHREYYLQVVLLQKDWILVGAVQQIVQLSKLMVRIFT